MAIKNLFEKASTFRLPSYLLLVIMTLILMYDVFQGKPCLFFIGYFLLTYVWCLFMNVLYNVGHEAVAWFLILFPFLLFFGFILRDLTGSDYVATMHELSVFPIISHTTDTKVDRLLDNKHPLT
jgi:hypothetical protein